MTQPRFGAFNHKICVNVAIHDIPRMVEEFKIQPISLNENEECASFLIPVQSSKLGDDETIVWILMHLIPDDIRYSINWQQSQY